MRIVFLTRKRKEKVKYRFWNVLKVSWKTVRSDKGVNCDRCECELLWENSKTWKWTVWLAWGDVLVTWPWGLPTARRGHSNGKLTWEIVVLRNAKRLSLVKSCADYKIRLTTEIKVAKSLNRIYSLNAEGT